jgi:hypothetical protein
VAFVNWQLRHWWVPIVATNKRWQVTRVRTSHVVIVVVAATVFVAGAAGVALAGPPAPPPPTTGGGATTAPSGGGGVTVPGGGGTTTPQTGGGSAPAVRHPGPPKVTSLKTIATRPGVITVRWHLPGDRISGIVVRRGLGSNCPVQSGQGVRIGGVARRSRQVDSTVAAGVRYCYTVFSKNRYGVAATHGFGLAAAPAARVVHTAVISTAMRIALEIVAAVATGVLLLAAVVLLVLKMAGGARHDGWQYRQPHHGGERMVLGRYEGAALVIPAVIAVVSLVLLIVVVLSL